MWIPFNLNPIGQNVGDCTIRAIAKATGQDWIKTYIGICIQGLLMFDMPSSNRVWGAYLRSLGFKRFPVLADDDYTVKDFCLDNPRGVYVLALHKHVICAIDGDYYDTGDSGHENPIYYWRRYNT